jgi:hypothetical protein
VPGVLLPHHTLNCDIEDGRAHYALALANDNHAHDASAATEEAATPLHDSRLRPTHDDLADDYRNDSSVSYAEWVVVEDDHHRDDSFRCAATCRSPIRKSQIAVSNWRLSRRRICVAEDPRRDQPGLQWRRSAGDELVLICLVRFQTISYNYNLYIYMSSMYF